MDGAGIFSKVIIDDKGDLFLLFSNPMRKHASKVINKEIFADAYDGMQDNEDLKFTMAEFPYNFKEVF